MRIRELIILVLLALAFTTNAQTITGSGNWSNSGNWLLGYIGGTDVNDAVVMQNSIDIVVQNGESYTIATLNVSKDGSLTIDLGGTLTITGAVNVDKDFTINVDGDLIINGDLDVAKSLQLNVTGNLTVLGDVTAAKDAQIDVQGDVTIGGDFTVDKDTQVNVDGTLDVTGTITAGVGSVLTGIGTVTSGGGCVGDPIFCGAAPMPVELIYFTGKANSDEVELTWATASEENFDYFSLERSVDGVDFKEITQIQGVGDSFERVDYEFTDAFPLKGISYYRLRSIDFDGYTEIFDYVMVEVDQASNDFSVYPNPIQNSQFSLQTNFVNDAELTIYNNVGRIEVQFTINDWLSDYKLNLPPGSYLFKVVTKEGVIVKRILIK